MSPLWECKRGVKSSRSVTQTKCAINKTGNEGSFGISDGIGKRNYCHVQVQDGGAYCYAAFYLRFYVHIGKTNQNGRKVMGQMLTGHAQHVVFIFI